MVEWGVPFALLWQFYDNDVLVGGSHNGFWMIDGQCWQQPIYEAYARFYEETAARWEVFAALGAHPRL